MENQENKISMYFHCRTCLNGKLSVGFTIDGGMQAWCDDCDKEVYLYDISSNIDTAKLDMLRFVLSLFSNPSMNRLSIESNIKKKIKEINNG